MTESQALYLFKGKKVLADGKPGTVDPSGIIRVRLEDGIVWIGTIDRLSDEEKGIESWLID